MARIQLDEPIDTHMNLRTAMRTRRSSRPQSAAPISRSQLSVIFDASLRIVEDHRPYPSGGGLYPIEAYCIITNATDIASGVYHYRPDSHALERLWDAPEHSVVKAMLFDTKDTPLSALIVLTSVWERSAVKYRHFAFELALMEAGHIAQNILLSATALSCATRPFGGFDREKIGAMLDIDPTQEDCVYVIALSA